MDSPSYSTLEQIVAASTQGYVVIAPDAPGYRIRFANRAYETMAGYAGDELGGTAWSVQFAGDEDSEELAVLKKAVADHESACFVLPLYRQDGSVWLCHVELTPLKADHEQVMLAQCRPASDDALPNVSTRLLQRTVDGPRHAPGSAAARMDAGPGLLSQADFLRLLARDIAIARRNESSVTILLFEVDELNVYRQTFGRNAAESCLRMIATQLTGTFGRASDLCARLDDEVFAVSIQGQGEPQARLLASRVAEKTRNLGLHNPRAQSSRYLSVKSAIVEVDVEVDEARGLLDRARQSLRGDGDRDPDRQSASS